MRHAHALDQFDAGDRRGTGTIRDDADVLHLAAGQVQRVDQPGGGDDGRAVLVVVEDRNLQTLAKLLLDDETFRRLDVFQIDPAEAWRQHRDGIDELVGVMRVDLEVEAVDIGELLEQDGLALHDRLRGGGADVAEAEHRRAVRDHGDDIAFRRVVVGGVGIGLDGKAGRGDTRRIGQRQIVLAHQGFRGCDLEFAGTAAGMEAEGFLVKL